MSHKEEILKEILEEVKEIREELKITSKLENNEDEFYIPGENIEKNNEIISKHISPEINGERREFEIALDNFDDIDYPDFLAPTLVASYHESIININCIAMINSSFNLNSNSIEFYYNLSLDSSGQHLVNFFITFKHTRRQKTVKKYESHTFNLKIKQRAFNIGGERYLPLNKIKSIEMYVVNKNPEGSRGTVTTVKNSGGGE